MRHDTELLDDPQFIDIRFQYHLGKCIRGLVIV